MLGCGHEICGRNTPGAFACGGLWIGKPSPIADSHTGPGSYGAGDGDCRAADCNCNGHARYRGDNRGASGRDYDGGTYAYVYFHTDSGSYGDAYADFYGDADPNGYGHADSNVHHYRDAYSHSYSYRNTDSDSNSHAYTDSGSYRDTHADPHGYRDACSH